MKSVNAEAIDELVQFHKHPHFVIIIGKNKDTALGKWEVKNCENVFALLIHNLFIGNTINNQ